MTIVPKRLGVKFSLKQAPRLQPADIVPIFQRWIQQHTVEGMLIDVIDYKHVPDGPGIILIADESDYAYDLADGQVGLNYIRKRDLPDDFGAALRLVFHCALKGAQALEAEAPDDMIFDYRSAKISFLDRMHYRNDSATFGRIRDVIASTTTDIYGSQVTVARAYEDPRRLFAVRVEALSDDLDLDDISRRLSESRQTA
ncbi:MAG: hypothetical protein OXG78_10390 [Chloroflexi bacterium]|nr:hypothetical protein [Chloroflexota bacterium]